MRRKLILNAGIKVRTKDFNEEGELTTQIIETTVGRVLFNEESTRSCRLYQYSIN